MKFTSNTIKNVVYERLFQDVKYYQIKLHLILNFLALKKTGVKK